MNSEVNIILTGDGIPNFVPTGATVHYGINKIPTAVVQLDPSSTALLCDFDTIRRRNVTLSIETTGGCLYFDGIIDGLSFSQSVGGLQTSLVIKSKFQWLTEVYPRIIGLHAGSLPYFSFIPTLKFNPNFADPDNPTKLNILLQQLKLYTGAYPLRMDQNFIDFIINLMLTLVDSQKFFALQANPLLRGAPIGLNQVLKSADAARFQLYPIIMSLLESIDTSATAGLDISAASASIGDKTIGMVADMRDTLYSNLLRMLGDMGCVLVIGNNKAYVVPEASYLYLPKIDNLNRGKVATRPNTIFPSEYDHISFNDNGYVNIKGVYVTHDPNTKLAHTQNSQASNMEMGSYIDTYATGNIYTTSLPEFISHGLVEAAAIGSGGFHYKIKNKRRSLSSKIKIQKVLDAKRTNKTQIDAGAAARKIYMDQWAKMQYCKLKFDDRSGSINAYFNNNWAPGAVGSLYTRNPGTYIDFYVTDVVHSFELSAPNSGKATSSISFKSGRVGATTGAGLDRIELFDYGYPEANAFCNSFLRNISS